MGKEQNRLEHTPPPWRATAHGQTISIDGPGYLGVAHINPRGDYNKGIPRAIDRANANLIKTAPLMWKLLCLVMDDDSTREQYSSEWQTIVNKVKHFV